LSSQRSTYTLGEDASDEGTQQAFADSIAANTDIALVDLQGVDLKLFLQPAGKIYYVCAILCNFHTCLYGSQTSEYFGVLPPDLETYTM
jgi:hypothetical protein